ncbi:MAG TPA: indolepyruvate/phenylpyruvate decarboxylase, partial [Myxococcales bacterium]
TYGAGALNAVNALASAYAERSPLVLLSGGPGKRESASGLLLHHQVRTLGSQLAVMAEVTCDHARLDDAARAPSEIARVLRSCLAHARPVYLEVPRDMVAAPCAPVEPLPPLPADGDAVAACADEVLARLDAARSPVLMVGIEVRRYGLEDRVAELARRLGVPVVTSFMGRGLLAGADLPLAGTYLGLAGDPSVTRLVEESDGLFLLGEIVSDTNFGASERALDLRKTIHAWDREVTLGYHVYEEVPLGALVEALLQRTRPSQRHFAVAPQVYPRGLVADGAPIAPADVAAAVNDLMARHGKMPIACDVGDCLFTAMDVDHTALVAPGYYATMGFGVPAGLGVQAATGRRPLVMVGDGAFQMTGFELGNCRRNGWDPIVLLFNNSGWEMLRAFQPGSRFNDLDTWDFASMAAGMGGDGVRVRTRAELGAALERAAAARGRFQLVEVMLPPGALSRTLERFVAGVRRVSQAPA